MSPPAQPVAEHWCVRRQDDNGNVFEIARGLTHEAAEHLAARYAASGHTQAYWVEREITSQSTLAHPLP